MERPRYVVERPRTVVERLKKGVEPSKIAFQRRDGRSSITADVSSGAKSEQMCVGGRSELSYKVRNYAQNRLNKTRLFDHESRTVLRNKVFHERPPEFRLLEFQGKLMQPYAVGILECARFVKVREGFRRAAMLQAA